MPGNIFSMDWLRNLSIKNKISIIIVLIIFVLLVEYANFWFSMKIVSGIRAYVGAEGLYSKGQKESYNSLLKYYTSLDEADYATFLKTLEDFPINARKFRLELDKQNSDYQLLGRLLVTAGNSSQDTNNMAFLYKWFRTVSYMHNAVQVWTRADEKVAEFLETGDKIHALMITPYDANNKAAVSLRAVEFSALVKQESDIDGQLTVLENSFSAVLGEASRAINAILLVITLALSIVVGLVVVGISMIIQRMIVGVDKTKTEFIALANHQLNTPLSIMKNAYAMVEDKSITAQEGVYYWGNGLKRITQVVEDFWSVLQIDGQMKYDIQKNDITSAVRKAVEYAQKTTSDHKKEIEIIIEKPNFTVPLVWCDIKQINNAIQNLLDNAVSYTKQGVISIAYEMEGKKYLKVNVKDSGIGFSPEDKVRLGQKFYRAKKALLARPDGSGLGLYICKNIVEKNKGRLFFESEGESKGSPFSFTLPIVK
jgi:signal transduction histidine kinase